MESESDIKSYPRLAREKCSEGDGDDKSRVGLIDEEKAILDDSFKTAERRRRRRRAFAPIRNKSVAVPRTNDLMVVAQCEGMLNTNLVCGQ